MIVLTTLFILSLVAVAAIGTQIYLDGQQSELIGERLSKLITGKETVVSAVPIYVADNYNNVQSHRR